MMEKQQKKAIFLICLCFGLWHVASQWTSVLLSFLHWDTDPVMTVTQIGYIQAFGSLCNAFGAFLFGQLVDSVGSKAVFLSSILLTSAYYASLSRCRSAAAFFFVQLLRVGFQFDAGAEFYAATVASEQSRTQAVMALSLPQCLAFVVGPLLAVKLAVWSSLRASQFFAGVFLLATMLPVVVYFLPESRPDPAARKFKAEKLIIKVSSYWPLLRRRKALREAILLRLLLVAPFICYELVCKQFLLRHLFRGPWNSALVMLATGLSIAVVQLVILPRVQRRLTPRQLLQMTILCQIFSYTFVASFGANSLYKVLLVTVIQSGAYVLAHAESVSQISSAVQSEELGSASGLASCTYWLTQVIIPVITVYIVTKLHYIWAFYCSALVSCLAFTYVTVWCRYLDARTEALLPTLGLQ